MDKTASVPSMPRKFQRMNAHEMWTKAASGTELQDHNPTREIQQVHRDLKDSISLVKSELYSVDHTEKLAMIDMVKQAKAGLSAGHSMEQVLYAAVSAVDATEPLMAKTAHDLCATIIEACADHQNSGFSKEASGSYVGDGKKHWGDSFLGHGQTEYDPKYHDQLVEISPKGFMYDLKERKMFTDPNKFKQHMKDPSRRKNEIMTVNATGGSTRKGAMREVKRLHGMGKEAHALQEVNPNHPIPQKFKKLAEANIQRKHLEVTLDELSKNMSYFNDRLIDDLTR